MSEINGLSRTQTDGAVMTDSDNVWFNKMTYFKLCLTYGVTHKAETKRDLRERLEPER